MCAEDGESVRTSSQRDPQDKDRPTIYAIAIRLLQVAKLRACLTAWPEVPQSESGRQGIAGRSTLLALCPICSFPRAVRALCTRPPHYHSEYRDPTTIQSVR